MMKPDFSQMTRPELRAYILANREDDDAIAALIERGNPNSPTYPCPQSYDDLPAMAEILKSRLSQNGDAA